MQDWLLVICYLLLEGTTTRIGDRPKPVCPVIKKEALNQDWLLVIGYLLLEGTTTRIGDRPKPVCPVIKKVALNRLSLLNSLNN